MVTAVDAMAPVLEDISIFLTAGRVRDPSVALTEGEDAERLGIARVWLSERYDLKEAGALLGGVAARTSRLGVGTAAVVTGSRHPLLTAALAATMQAMYGPRFILGLGRSSEDFLRGQGISAPTLSGYRDYVDIVRRLLAGETVSYDGPAGSYESLRAVETAAGAPPPIWSAILGLPNAARLAGQIADGVILQPFLTPEAVRRAVTWIRKGRDEAGLDPAGIRICAPVVIACELDDHETAALTRGRLVTYIQMKAYADGFARANDWDPAPMLAVQNHRQFAHLDRANADQVFHRDQLLEPAELIPDSWIREGSATGSVEQCVRKIQEFTSAGADEIALYGSTPVQNTSFLQGWRRSLAPPA